MILECLLIIVCCLDCSFWEVGVLHVFRKVTRTYYSKKRLVSQATGIIHEWQRTGLCKNWISMYLWQFHFTFHLMIIIHGLDFFDNFISCQVSNLMALSTLKYNSLFPFNPFTPKSAIWHYKTHCFLKNCNFLNRANFALSISCEHCLEGSSHWGTQGTQKSQRFLQNISI